MTVDVTWGNAGQTILRGHIHGKISWDEYQEAGLKVYELTISVRHRVDVILTADVDAPPGNPLPHIKKASLRLQQADNLGYCISVVPSSFTVVRSVMATLFRIYGISHKFPIVGSMIDAYRLIEDATGLRIELSDVTPQ